MEINMQLVADYNFTLSKKTDPGSITGYFLAPVFNNAMNYCRPKFPLSMRNVQDKNH